MMRKIRKCITDFKNCEFFEYYGFEFRNDYDHDSDDEPDVFNPYSIRNTMRKQVRVRDG